MNRREKIRERIRIASGCFLVFLLLVFVFYMAAYDRSAERSKNNRGTLRELGEIQEILLLESGKTTWSYLDMGMSGKEGYQNGGEWTQKGYDTSSWKAAAGSFGSVKGELEIQADNRLPRNLLNLYQADGNTVPVYYFRTEFEVRDIASIASLEAKLVYDDAALVYLNGQLIYSLNNPDNGYTGDGYGAKVTVDSSQTETFLINDVSALVEGRNVLAVELHQLHESSSDIYFDFKYLMASEKANERKKPGLEGLVLEPGESEESVRVNWLTGDKGAYEIMWQEESSDSRNGNGWSRRLMGGEKTGIQGSYSYNAVLEGIEPGKIYVYQIRNLADNMVSDTKRYTAPDGEGFAFCFAGDPQIGAEDLEEDGALWQSAVETALEGRKNMAFIITAGDQINSADPEEAMEEFRIFRRPELLKEIPVAVNRGNHESSQTGMDEQFQRFTGSDNNYYFTYRNTLFFAVNTNSKNYEEQLKRLKAAIRKTSPEWIIVTMHYSMFGGRNRSEDESVMNTRRAYAQAFSELNVDLVLSGHDHLYSRSYYMTGEQETDRDGGSKQPGEVMYLSGGTVTGSKYYKKETEHLPHSAFTYQEKEPTITYIQVEAGRLSLITCRLSDMEVIDSCEIVKK